MSCLERYKGFFPIQLSGHIRDAVLVQCSTNSAMELEISLALKAGGTGLVTLALKASVARDRLPFGVINFCDPFRHIQRRAVTSE
jgi:hypothetical protein